jgi:hypothetical protein
VFACVSVCVSERERERECSLSQISQSRHVINNCMTWAQLSTVKILHILVKTWQTQWKLFHFSSKMSKGNTYCKKVVKMSFKERWKKLQCKNLKKMRLLKPVFVQSFFPWVTGLILFPWFIWRVYYNFMSLISIQS